MPNLLFILGRGRSGTTLISKMLDNHAKVAVAPEGFFVMNLVNKYQNKRWTAKVIDEFTHDLFLENRMKTWHLDPEKVKDALKANQEELDFTAACSIVYRIYGEHTGKELQWIGDKNPHYALFSKDLINIFPDCKFIFITRDFRDNILSYQKVPFDMADVTSLAYRWTYYNKGILRMQEAYPEQFLRLSYEALVEQPDATLKRLCEFLNIPYEPSMQEYYKSDDPDFYGKSSSWFKELYQPLDPNKLYNWKKYMPEKERQKAEYVSQNVATQLGYETSNGKYGMKYFFLTLAGRVKGWLFSSAEKLLFYYCPLKLRIFVINKYRSNTGRV